MTENPYPRDRGMKTYGWLQWNEGYNAAIEDACIMLSRLPCWQDDLIWMKVQVNMESLRKEVSHD